MLQINAEASVYIYPEKQIVQEVYIDNYQVKLQSNDTDTFKFSVLPDIYGPMQCKVLFVL